MLMHKKSHSWRGSAGIMNDHAARRLAWDGCLNVRDVGGYATTDGKATRWRAVLRADNLCQLTPAGCADLRAYGVQTIIDLRSPTELARTPHPFAPQATADASPAYLNLPMLDEQDLEGNAALDAAPTMFELYRAILERYPAQLLTVLAAVADAPPRSVLLHCHAGK